MNRRKDASVAPEREADVAQVVEGSNSFATDLYSRLASGADNLFFSPSSVFLALGMTYAGADGETAYEMADVLHFSLPEARLHAAFQELQQSTRTGGVELRIANRLWGQSGYHFLSEFLETTERFYGARLEGVDFVNGSEDARNRINDWVAAQTAGKIRDLIGPGVLDPMTRLVLTNAIYFLGSWEHEFKEDATKPMPFHAPGRERSVPTMVQTHYFPFAEFDDVQVLELPYRSQSFDMVPVDGGDIKFFRNVEIPGGGSDLGMCIVLPRANDGLPAIEAGLSPAMLSRWLATDSHRVEVYLPKFRIEAAFLLNDTLSSMGMRKAFGMEADFSRMSDDPEGLYIAAALHKAFVDVNEKGTEAAAATAVVMVAGGMVREPEPKIFRADRPFLFMIRDRKTGLIHFMGRVTDPSH